MKAEDLKAILESHRRYLETEGLEGRGAYLAAADLRGANLRGANLSRAYLLGADLAGVNLIDADLTGADLTGAYLTDASLRGADLRGAYLEGANLTNAYLAGANLRGANLTDANLTNANLRGGANLTDANLRGADLAYARLPDFQLCPQEGSFIAYKQVGRGVVLKLEILGPRTSSLVGRKCRTSHARVLAALNSGELVFLSQYASTFIYRVGEVVAEPQYDSDFRVECARGIHFYMTESEASRYGT